MSRIEASFGSAHGFEMEGESGRDSEEDTPRTIRRAFAFDEWEEEDKNTPNDSTEANVEWSSGTSGYSRGGFQDTAEHMYNSQDEDRYTIRRTFSFDEWDEESTEFLAIHNDHETREKCTTLKASFAPISNEEDCDTRVVEADMAETVNRLAAISFLTKFDLDKKPITVTPSLASKNRNRIQRPFPLYAHQAVEHQISFSVPTTKSSVSHEHSKRIPTRSSTNSNHYIHQSPTDYEGLENMIRKLWPHPSDTSAPHCPSIPREASAFRKVTPTSFGSIPADTRNHEIASPEHNERPADGIHHSLDARDSRADQNWFDCYGSGSTLFPDDDIFESPTNLSEDSDSHGIPRFIVFQSNE